MQGNSVMTLSNSIIGVSILAMPFCFQQCGIILSLIILFFTSIISRLACHFLLKSAIISKRRSFELLAFHIFGPAGKTVIELSIVGFLMGSCVAFFVVVGDLGPAIIKSVLNLEMSVQALRPALLIGVAVFIVLPLGLLRDIDSLSSVCAISIAFYIVLVLRIILEATPPIFASSWAGKVNYWRPAGILQCLPIFSSALSCQTQLFEIFASFLNGPLDKINGAIKSSVNMCTAVYMGVGLFGYIAFCSQPLTGNALMNFPPSFGADIMKLSFIVSVALSFPLVIFPCRASLYSFLYHQTHSPHYELLARDNRGSSQNVLTLLIVTISLVLALLVPSIELVLGLLGSTIGVILCYILPSVFFTRLLKKNTNERLLAQIVIIVGVFIMVLGTYANLFATEEALSGQDKENPLGSSLNFVAPPEKDPLSVMNVVVEEPKKQVDEPFSKDGQELREDQVKLSDGIKKDADQVKSVDSDQVKLVYDIKKEERKELLNPIELVDSVKKEVRKEPSEPLEPVNSIKKEIEKEPLEPFHLSDLKKAVINDEQPKALDSYQKLNGLQPESVNRNEIYIEKSEHVADKSQKVKILAEKQIENPNENEENLLSPLNMESEKVPSPRSRKIMMPNGLSDASGSNSMIHSSKKNTGAANNNVNLEVNLKPEIMDKLKDTVPLPIALQKNINVFNFSVSQNAELLKKQVSTVAEKVINRDLLGQKSDKDLLDRERRDVHSLGSKTLLIEQTDSKLIGNKLTDNKNELSESSNLTVRGVESVNQVDSSELTLEVKNGKATPGKNTLSAGKKPMENKHSSYSVEGNIGKVSYTGEKSISFVSEMLDVLIGDFSTLKLEVREEKTVSDENKQDALLAKNLARTDKKLSEASGKQGKREAADQVEIKKVTEESSKSNPNIDEPPKLNPVNKSLSKGDTLKEVLKNSNSLSGIGEEICPKNKTISEKSVVAAASSKQQRIKKRSNGKEQSKQSKQSDTIHFKIQSAGHLSNPENPLENFRVFDADIRNVFHHVVKPLKRDLKSLEANQVSSVSSKSILDDSSKLFKEDLDGKVRKKIEFKDNR